MNNTPTKIIKTAVVGLGGRGLYFAKAYSQQGHAGFDLRAVCDLNEAKLATARKKLGDDILYFTDLNEMLKSADIDVLIVATNDPHHVEPSLAALAAGKHVLVEKPLCQTINDAHQMITAARKAPGIFMIGFELRSCPVFVEMKKLLDEGRIGEVKIGHCFDNVSVGGNYFFHDPHRQKDFYQSLLLQKATHSLDLLNWFMNSDPVKVYAEGGLDYYGGGVDMWGNKVDDERRCRNCPEAHHCPYAVDYRRFAMDYDAVVEKDDVCVWSNLMNLNDNSLLNISYANGSRATFHECHFTSDYSREFTLTGTKGKMYGYYDNPGRFLIRIEYAHSAGAHTEEWKPQYLGGGHGGGDPALREEFYQRIIGNRNAGDELDSAYYSTALAICAEQSIGSGAAISIPPLSQI
jgi:predicted dehydrogenase